ncbi:MAG TPA: hypothetical protein VFY84_14635 [Jiangellales bacterium]|nr:hypothetical protein [Jiangellales bacterium]
MTAGHLDATRLAEHAEGLLRSSEAAAVDSHLQECAECRATAAGLASVSAMLAAAPPTLPIPAQVVAEIDRALADEATRATQPAPVIQLSWFRRRAPALLAAAATVGVLSFAGWAISTGGGGDDDAGGATTAESSGGEAEQEAADAGAATDDSLESPEEQAAPEPFQGEDGAYAADPELADEIRTIAEEGRLERDVDGTCGSALAGELGAELVGAARTEVTGETAVLVVVRSDDDPALVHGWVLPTCDATSGEALRQQSVELE